MFYSHADRASFPFPVTADFPFFTFLPGQFRTLAAHITETEPDVIYVPRSSDGCHFDFIRALLLQDKPPKYIASEHVAPKVAEWTFKSSFRRELIYTAADAVHLLTTGYVKSLPEFLWSKTWVIHNPAIMMAQPPVAVTYKRKIVSSGRLALQKNFPVLIEAFAIAQREHPDWYLEIYGDGPQHGNLKDLIKFHGVQEFAEIKPFTLDIHEQFTTDDIYVQCSLWEGYPLALKEAVVRGVPVIAFEETGGTDNIVSSGRNGILLEGRISTEKLARAMVSLMGDGELRRRIASEAAEIDNGAEPEQIVQQWEDMFRTVAAAKNSNLGALRDRNAPASQDAIAYLPSLRGEVTTDFLKPVWLKAAPKEKKKKSIIGVCYRYIRSTICKAFAIVGVKV